MTPARDSAECAFNEALSSSLEFPHAAEVKKVILSEPFQTAIDPYIQAMILCEFFLQKIRLVQPVTITAKAVKEANSNESNTLKCSQVNENHSIAVKEADSHSGTGGPVSENEEIEAAQNYLKEPYDHSNTRLDNQYKSFRAGVKWYRDQLRTLSASAQSAPRKIVLPSEMAEDYTTMTATELEYSEGFNAALSRIRALNRDAQFIEKDER